MIYINPVINNNINTKPAFCNGNKKLPEIKIGDFNKIDVVKSDDKSVGKSKLVLLSSLLSIGAILFTLNNLSKYKSRSLGKKINMFNMHLKESDILALGSATVLGATAGGLLLDDPKYKKAKVREASHQIIGNIATPLVAIWGVNKILDKMNIKLPKIKGNSKILKAANFGLEILPNLIGSCVGLYAGINVGNIISNKINDNIFGKRAEKREVKIEDYCIHIDDPITVLTLADKSGKIKAFTGKVMPFVFILSGYQAGTARE